LAKVPYDKVLATTKQLFDKNQRKFATFAALLAPTHHTVIVTGSPQFIAEAAAEVLGIDQTISTFFAVEQGVFTGKISQRLAYEAEKVVAVRQALPHFKRRGSFAFGDSEGDAGILGMAEHAICINPSRGLRLLAKKNQWLIANNRTVDSIIQGQLADQTARTCRSQRR
ncbi:MAG TPA: HAD-IB family phosphatase, partial [Candidatus Acidoferrum sp.]|nr:HAD-IB family phosphatase [Candidatus Acidoferrum sp.]